MSRVFSDVGSRMGEENEALRNLLSDTAGKIGEARRAQGSLRQDRRAVQQHLARARKGKSADAGSVRHAGGVARGPMTRCAPNSTRSSARPPRSKPNPKSCARISNCRANPTAGWKSAQIELTNEHQRPHSQIGQLERNLAQESAERRSIGESRRALQDQFDGAEKRIGQLEGELAAGAREIGAARRREALAASRGRFRAQRDRPPVPPTHGNRKHADRAAPSLARSNRALPRPMPNAAAWAPRSTRPRNIIRRAQQP